MASLVLAERNFRLWCIFADVDGYLILSAHSLQRANKEQEKNDDKLNREAVQSSKAGLLRNWRGTVYSWYPFFMKAQIGAWKHFIF